jgi:hypothetical protein
MYITIFDMASITKITRMIAKNWFERLGPKKGGVRFEGLTSTELVLTFVKKMHWAWLCPPYCLLI